MASNVTLMSLTASAIATVRRGQGAFFKFLSANDVGLTGGHQSGVLISLKAMRILFDAIPMEHIVKRRVRIRWQDDITTTSAFTYYESKRELRLTRLGRKFPYLTPDVVGALFVLVRMDVEDYYAYILDGDEAVDVFLGAFGLGPQDANDIIPNVRYLQPELVMDTPEQRERQAIEEYVRTLGLTPSASFPKSDIVSAKARDIQELVYDHKDYIRQNPDLKLIEYIRVEYAIFRQMEQSAYGAAIESGFSDIEEFIATALSLLNRRKSRAGKSFEHQLSAIFAGNGLLFAEQVRTEGNKRPDFIFPSGQAYHDTSFPASKIVVLAAKTTCKDRWRQILTEADRMKNQPKFLVTMQQGNSPGQLDEMLAANVQLIVPKPYIGSYPREYRCHIWTVRQFISYVRETTRGA